MTSCASFIFLFLFSFLITSFTASAQNIFYIKHICPNTTTYSRNSTYFTNLRTLLSSLSSPNASYSTGFQNATAGQAPDRVTGLFLCRGDISPEVCRNCVAISINDTLIQCPNERQAVFYYDECMLRYFDRNILSTLAYDGAWFRLNGNISIDQNQMNRFKDFVSSTMNQAALEAASNARKFYTIKANWTALQTLYGLVQCTPDLTRQDCLSCLESFINVMPLYKTGGRFLYSSCNLRFELFAFYNETAIRTQPQQAWRSWRNGSPLKIVNPTISKNCDTEEVTRCIHIALLCVQHHPTDRASLSTIYMMLTNNSHILPDPQQPGFYFPDKSNQERDGIESDTASSS